MMIDAVDGITEQDVKILGYVHEQGKPSIICMNKWDLVEKDTYTINKFDAKLQEALKFMDYFKSIYISAKTGLRTEKLLKIVDEVYENAHFRVTTGKLNDMIIDAVRMNEPPSYKGKRLKIMYGSQISVAPPVFLFFVNDVTLLHFSYKRYLENEIRRAFNFEGTPIRLIVREQEKND
jgi:GTP-binding protein